MLRVTTILTGEAGSPYYSTQHFQGGASAAQAALDKVNAFWTAIQGSLSTQVSWAVQQDVSVVDPATGKTTGFAGGTVATGEGEDASQILPPECQALVQFTTAGVHNGRRIRGKLFVPGICTHSLATSGNWVSAFISGVTNVADTAFDIPSTGSDGEFCIYSTTAQAAYPVTSASVMSEVAVLRSRRN